MIDIQVADKVLESRIIDAVCGQYKYQDKIKNENGLEIDNPISKAAFTQNIVRSFLTEVTVAYESNKAAQIARDACIAKAKSEISI